MIRKFWFSMFLTGVVLMAGCGKEAGEKPKSVEAGATRVKLETSMGDIIIELEEEAAPVTVKNFLRYTEEGFYDGMIFHRVIPNFMIQGGGFATDLKDKPTHAMIVNEFKLSNVRGTIAMAKLGGNPNSATSQFFINLKDNSGNLDRQNGGFTVFAKVVKGMDVADSIAKVRTTTKIGTIRGRKLQLKATPVELVVIRSAKVVSGK
jgi:cyclophilin family peptidyl-prolyl cis-trans isomerase